jgi:hypothetical protein
MLNKLVNMTDALVAIIIVAVIIIPAKHEAMKH